MSPWKILVVDDEEGIHGITRMIFRDYEFEQRPIELISAMSSAQAREKLSEHSDIALILLDVVMETEDAGLLLVEDIRHQQGNQDVRIILRTGHPGYAPEAQVIIQYDINDYLSKAELSASRLLTSVIVALRSYRDITSARQQPKSAEAQATPDTLLPEASQILQQQIAPAVKQGQRLSQMSLNPVAADISRDLQAHQLRLSNSIELLASLTPQNPQPRFQRETLALSELADRLLQTFLPQSRQEGWLLDFHQDAVLPDSLETDASLTLQLLISMLELAIFEAQGSDLKLSFLAGSSPSELRVRVEALQANRAASATPWMEQLRKRIQSLSQQLSGRFSEPEHGHLVCELPTRH